MPSNFVSLHHPIIEKKKKLNLKKKKVDLELQKKNVTLFFALISTPFSINTFTVSTEAHFKQA